MGFFSGAFGGLVGAVGNLIGGKKAADNSKAAANMNINAQKEFAQNGIRWRVEDAKAAGIHPLYALGASTNSFSPVSGYTGDYGIGDAVNTFGQGIDRAARAKMTERERQDLQARQEMQEVFQLADMNMRKEESDAKVLMYKSEALRNFAASQQVLKNTGLPPALPSVGTPNLIPGQGDSPRLEGTVSTGEKKYQFMQQPNGSYSLHPGNDWSQLYEDKGFILEQYPIVSTMVRDYWNRATGGVVDGMVYSDSLHGWVPVNSKEGRAVKDSFSGRARRHISDVVDFYSRYND